MNRCTVKTLRWMLLTLSMLGFAACAASLPNYAAIVANPDRPANERELDEARKPSEVLAFYGVKSGDKVADLWAGREGFHRKSGECDFNSGAQWFAD